MYIKKQTTQLIINDGKITGNENRKLLGWSEIIQYSFVFLFFFSGFWGHKKRKLLINHSYFTMSLINETQIKNNYIVDQLSRVSKIANIIIDKDIELVISSNAV